MAIFCAQVCSGCEAASAPAASSGAREAWLLRARSGRHPEGVLRRFLYWCDDAVRCWRRESGRRERASLLSSSAAARASRCRRAHAPMVGVMWKRARAATQELKSPCSNKDVHGLVVVLLVHLGGHKLRSTYKINMVDEPLNTRATTSLVCRDQSPRCSSHSSRA